MRIVLAPLFVLALMSAPRSAELPPLSAPAKAWAAQMGHGAVATAEKRAGRWDYAIAGEPFAPGHAAVPPERVIFEIGSISKVFTALLLADAVRSGKLGLDDTLAQRLPVTFDDPAVGAITLRQLATHASCLPRLPDNMRQPNAADPYAEYGDEQLFEFLAHAKLGGKPPCEPAYSNLGVGVLGVVLERAHGKPWATLVQERITGPLGMTDTVQVLSEEQTARFALPWSGASRAQPWTFRAMSGAGALRSTLGDMSRFADALLAGTAGPLGESWTMLAGSESAPGLVFARHVESGAVIHSHDGGTGGFRSVLRVQPGSGAAILLLASNAEAAPAGWLSSWLFPKPIAGTLPRVVLPAALLDEYAGEYALSDDVRFTIVRRGDGLMSRVTGQVFFPIFARAKDEFFYEVVDARMSFVRDAAGKVTGLVQHQSGRDMPAPRLPTPPPQFLFLGAAALAEYAGDYDFGGFQPGSTITVSVNAETLHARLTGQPALPLACMARDRFAYDVVQAMMSFERNAAGRVVAATLHQNGMDMRAPRK